MVTIILITSRLNALERFSLYQLALVEDAFRKGSTDRCGGLMLALKIYKCCLLGYYVLLFLQ